jgi:hypothetical protein
MERQMVAGAENSSTAGSIEPFGFPPHFQQMRE